MLLASGQSVVPLTPLPSFLVLELHKIIQKLLYGFGSDYIKCFDLIPQEVVPCVALEQGMDLGTHMALKGIYNSSRTVSNYLPVSPLFPQQKMSCCRDVPCLLFSSIYLLVHGKRRLWWWIGPEIYFGGESSREIIFTADLMSPPTLYSQIPPCASTGRGEVVKFMLESSIYLLSGASTLASSLFNEQKAACHACVLPGSRHRNEKQTKVFVSCVAGSGLGRRMYHWYQQWGCSLR